MTHLGHSCAHSCRLVRAHGTVGNRDVIGVGLRGYRPHDVFFSEVWELRGGACALTSERNTPDLWSDGQAGRKAA